MKIGNIDFLRVKKPVMILEDYMEQIKSSKYLMLTFLLMTNLFLTSKVSAAASASTSVTGGTYWSAATWSTSGGGVAPATNGGTYAESVTVNGLGTGDIFYVDISLTISTLTLNANGSNPTLYIMSGQTLHITGNLVNSNNNVHFYVDAGATLIVDGTLSGNQNNLFGGSGTVSGGTLDLGNNAGCISGNCPTINFTNCTAGGTFCSDHNVACVTNNTIRASSTSICSGSTVSFTGNTPTISSGTLSYIWESSTTSSSSGFSTAAGTSNTQNYATQALSTTTWFRRYASNGSCGVYSSVIQVTVTVTGTPSVSISASTTSICSSTTSITFTATPTYGGSSPSYQWKKNGTNVATGSSYTNSTWTSGDRVTCVMTSNYTCISGSSSATSNSVTITVASSGGWLGTTSSDWNTSSNWCGGVPTSSTNVTIPSGTTYSPVISAAGAVCKNLTISSGASLTITSSRTLTVSGNIVNNSTISGTGILIMGGSSPQTLSGTAGSYGNITINNSSGVTASSALTITGILTLTSSGIFTSGGNVTIDLGTGAIDGSGLGSISGNIIVKKNASSSGYHYISSALGAATLANFNLFVAPNWMFYYNESVVTSDSMAGWTDVGNYTTYALSAAKGYALYFYNSSTTIQETSTYSHGASYSSILSHSSSNGGNANTGGWNLVGNPYPSTIDWEASSGWTKTGMDNSIYYWNPATETYASYVGGLGTNGATQYIPSMQGFFIHVSAVGTGTLGMTNSVRVTSSNPSLWKKNAVANILRLKASDGNYSDETVISLNDDATNSFDGEYDAYKMFNESNAPDLCSRISGIDYSINSLSTGNSNIIVPLKLKVNFDGKYNFTASGLESFSTVYDIILEDRLMNVKQDLKLNPTYNCQVSQGESSNRFFINFNKTALKSGLLTNNSSILINGSHQAVNIQFINNDNKKASVVICNTTGEEIFSSENIDVSSGEILITVPSIQTGIYVVKVMTSDRIESEKVILGQ